MEEYLKMLEHAQKLLDEASSYLGEKVLPCDEGDALAESLATAAMNVRSVIRGVHCKILTILKELDQ